jgi:hypothetical protein
VSERLQARVQDRDSKSSVEVHEKKLPGAVLNEDRHVLWL